MSSRSLLLLRDEQGIVLIVVLSIMIMIALLGTAAVMTSRTEVDISGAEKNNSAAFYAAEGGVEKAVEIIKSSYTSTGNPPSPLPSGSFSLNGFTVTYNTAQEGTTQFELLDHGSYRGLYAMVETFRITSQAEGWGARAQVSQVVEDALVPIFQFAVFYEHDLEVHPGPPMTLGGRVHTNSDMYLGAESEGGLDIDSYTTAAGRLYHGRKPGSGKTAGTGDVRIKDRGGDYQSMQNGDGSWLDHSDENWVANSLDRWDGLVEDGAHGITELYMPVVTSGEPIDLIKRGSDNPNSFEHKAGLKLVDGQALYYDESGNWQNVTQEMRDSGILTDATFYDYREGETVLSYDLDICRLNSCGYYPRNGIVYVAHTDDNRGAVRLVNGSLLAASLTVATKNPLYIRGDFNTQEKKPASVLTDALNILSNNWEDENSDLGLENRVASNTTINVAYLTGNINSENSNYSGGLENLPRFLENWQGKDFTYRGSMIDLWFSQQATGLWHYGGNYYKAPNRDWAFDADLLDRNKLPPGTPQVNVVQRGIWTQDLAYKE